MNNHIYTVEIFFKDGSVHSRKNMNIIHDYAKSCELYKGRATALFEVEGYKVIADEIAEFFHKVPM